MLEVSHNSCNIGTSALPDMYALAHHGYISGNALVPMLQLLNIYIRAGGTAPVAQALAGASLSILK